MLIAKLLGGEAAVAIVTAAAAQGVNGIAESVVLLTGALAGVLWFWAKILRPIATTVRTTANAISHIEEIPQLADRLERLENNVKALVRDLNVETRSPDQPQ